SNLSLYSINSPLQRQRTGDSISNLDPIEQLRLEHYNLDYPINDDLLYNYQFTDRNSRFFSRLKKRNLNLPKLLPYKTENFLDQAKYLSHIVTHLYIAINSLDLQGVISISSNDLNFNAYKNNDQYLSDNEATNNESNNNQNLFEINDHSNSDSDSDSDSDDDDDDVDNLETLSSSSAFTNSKKSSAVVNVRHWTSELKTWIKMKNNMPISLKIDLIKVYYYLSLARGQPIALSAYVDMFVLLIKSDIYILKQFGLRLDYLPLYKEFENIFPHPDASFDTLNKSTHKHLMRLALYANYFFDDSPDTLLQIFQKCLSKYSIPTASLSLSTLYSLLPCSSIHILKFYPSFFHIWQSALKIKNVDSHITSLLARSTEFLLIESSINTRLENLHPATFGKFGYFTLDQFDTLFTNLLNSLKISTNKFGSTSSSSFYTGFSTMIVFSINGSRSLEDDGLLDKLSNIIDIIETYLHPSNTGEWSSNITQFLTSLITQYLRRFNLESFGSLSSLPSENKLNDQITKRFINILLPKILVGIQSKLDVIARLYIASLSALCYLNSELVLSSVLLDFYESLTSDSTPNHRLMAVIRQFTFLGRYFVSTKVFRIHVVKLLSLTIPAIDSNDLNKTLCCLMLILTLASFTPFADLTKSSKTHDNEFIDPNLADDVIQNHLMFLQSKFGGLDDIQFDGMKNQDYFTLDDELEKKALMSSTLGFENLLNQIIYKLFPLVENLPEPSRKEANSENNIQKVLTRTVAVLFESLSDELFEKFSDQFLLFIRKNVYYNANELVSNISGLIVKRDCKKQFPKFMLFLLPRIYEDISENGAGISRSGIDVLPRDQPLFCYLAILNSCALHSYDAIFEFQDDIIHLSSMLFHKLKGPAVYVSSYFVHEVLDSLTTIRLKETRLINPIYAFHKGVDETCWGGFQFDESRFSKENLSFDWYIPSRRETEFAIRFFTLHVDECLNSMNELIRNSTEINSLDVLSFTDEFRKCLSYLSHALSGISGLLDPNFDEKMLANNNSSTNLIGSKLATISRIRKDYSATPNIFEDQQPNSSGILVSSEENKEEDKNQNDITDDSILEQNPPNKQDDDSMTEELASLEGLNIESVRMSPSISTSSTYNIPSDFSTNNMLGPSGSGFDDGSMTPLANPSLTLREQKLYNCNYFFGDDNYTKYYDDLYVKINQLHKKIGMKLHDYFEFLVKNNSNDVKLINMFLYCLNIWFCDVGFESSLKDMDESKIGYKFMSDIQGIYKVRKPFTRITLGSRIMKYHRQRCSLHANSRFQTLADSLLLEDLLNLSTSVYSEISHSAQNVLVDAMKKVLGSYKVLEKYLFSTRDQSNNIKPCFVKTLDSKNYKTIKNLLHLFQFKRIKNNVFSDYKNISTFVEFLINCLLYDDTTINDLAFSIYKDFIGSLKVPSSVCLIDLKKIDCIKPPDDFAQHDIKAVKCAKDRKRKFYLDQLKGLQKQILELEKSKKNHWKLSLLNLTLLINLQNDIDIDLNMDVFSLLVERTIDKHPVISGRCISGLTKLFDKINTLSMNEYVVSNRFDLNFLPKEFMVVDTNSNRSKISYTQPFLNEMKNIDNPSYFIDNKAYIGWLFWDSNLTVVNPQNFIGIKLKKHEAEICKNLNLLITKEWFQHLVHLIIQNNYIKSSFQVSHVYLIVIIVHLISNNYLSRISYQDLLETLEKTYEKDEKSTHIVVCEFICGLLLSTKYTLEEYIPERDKAIKSMLKMILENDLNPENSTVWKIFSWWIPSHADTRRFYPVIRQLIEFELDKNSNSAVIQSIRLKYLKSFLTVVTWKYLDKENLLDLLLKNASFPYEAVRKEIGGLLYVTVFSFLNESFTDALSFIESNQVDSLGTVPYVMPKHVFAKLCNKFDEIELLYSKISPDANVMVIMNSDYVHASKTMLSWLNQMLRSCSCLSIIGLIPSHIFPFLFKLATMKDVCKLGNINLTPSIQGIAQIPYTKGQLQPIVDMIVKFGKVYANSWHELLRLIVFVEVFYFKQSLNLSVEDRRTLFEYIQSLLFNSNLEVRELSSSTLSGMIHVAPQVQRELLIKECIEKFGAILTNKKKKNKLPNGATIKFHGAVLGLGSLVAAYPYVSPPPKWIPDVVSILSNKTSGYSGLVDKTAKEILSNFKKTRQDTWKVDSRIFSEEQLEDLEGVLWKSYFI
ncbi:proteasome activator BLM10 ASCRUDRAFT_27819, partial [Ascoidea rubescens DSM 1968]